MSIYRAYDIRGIYGQDITDEIAEKVGNILRYYTKDSLVVGMDCRISSPNLKKALVKGATSAGINIVDVGMVPRGVAMFWAWKVGVPSVYISASHLPPEWNGIKFNFANGGGFPEGETLKIEEKIKANDFVSRPSGKLTKENVLDRYMDFVIGKIPEPHKPLKVLLDCGNGTAGVVAPQLFRKHKFNVDVLFEKPDGNFPNRESELTEHALEKAKKSAKKYDVTIAYDGDADRISLVDNKGKIVIPEVVACLIMSELLKKEKGPIVANVECSNIIDSVAKGFDRKVFRTPVGYKYVIEGVHNTEACFGIEKSMHFCIPSILPFDDGIPASLYAAYVLSKYEKKLSDFVKSAPKFLSQMVNFECNDDIKFKVMDSLKKRLTKEYRNANTMDGVRVDLDNGWVLIRASNTSPLIRMTVESEREDDLIELREKFSDMLKEEMWNFQR